MRVPRLCGRTVSWLDGRRFPRILHAPHPRFLLLFPSRGRYGTDHSDCQLFPLLRRCLVCPRDRKPGRRQPACKFPHDVPPLRAADLLSLFPPARTAVGARPVRTGGCCCTVLPLFLPAYRSPPVLSKRLWQSRTAACRALPDRLHGGRCHPPVCHPRPSRTCDRIRSCPVMVQGAPVMPVYQPHRLRQSFRDILYRRHPRRLDGKRDFTSRPCTVMAKAISASP